jgi:hypothetical protein
MNLKLIDRIGSWTVAAVLMVGLFYMFNKVEMGQSLDDAIAVDDFMADVWQNESSPSDRRAMLEGLSAMDCIDLGLCQLSLDLPVADLPITE